MTADTVTFSIGQVVPWPPAPMGFAQVSDLYRTKVQLCYPFKNGRVARPVVRASDLVELQRRLPLLLADLHNPYDRAALPRSKAFVICPPPVLRKKPHEAHRVRTTP